MAQKPVAITLVEDIQPWTDASTNGTLKLSDGSTGNLSDFLLPLGCFCDWPIVVINSSPKTLSLAKIVPFNGDQTHYPAITDLQTTELSGTKDKIPGTRPHPTKPGKTLTAIGVWGFAYSSFPSRIDVAMGLTHDGDPGLNIYNMAVGRIGVAIRYDPFWQNPTFAVTSDLNKFITSNAKKPEDVLQKFFDDSTSPQGPSHDDGVQTIICGNFESPLGQARPLIVWIRPGDGK